MSTRSWILFGALAYLFVFLDQGDALCRTYTTDCCKQGAQYNVSCAIFKCNPKGVNEGHYCGDFNETALPNCYHADNCSANYTIPVPITPNTTVSVPTNTSKTVPTPAAPGTPTSTTPNTTANPNVTTTTPTEPTGKTSGTMPPVAPSGKPANGSTTTVSTPGKKMPSGGPHFDVGSFVGGIVLCAIIVSIILGVYKCKKAKKRENPYAQF